MTLQDGMVLGEAYRLSSASKGMFEVAPPSVGFLTPSEVLAPLGLQHIVPGGGLVAMTGALSLNTSLCLPRGLCSLGRGTVLGLPWARGGCLLADSMTQLDLRHLALKNCSI